MTSIAVDITRITDSSFPGWVECVLCDAHGVAWTFVEKVPFVTAENISESSSFPCRGSFACEVVSASGGALVEIDTSRPWGIEATDGTTKFVVHKEQLLDA
ncbi:MAG TPA: hypothetical protein VFQ26_10000 [Nitrospiraceae bacterium]|nr:hypothetical protein [Nitrospiraceae bacterium]